MPELHLAIEDIGPLLAKMKKSESELSPVIYFDHGFSPSDVSSAHTWGLSASFGLLRENKSAFPKINRISTNLGTIMRKFTTRIYGG